MMVRSEPTVEWRTVDGWPRYEVSEDGQVRNVDTGDLLKPWRLSNGRWQIQLRRSGERKAFLTYQLVARAFLGEPPFAGAEVAHRDDDKDHNHWRNLRWSTHQANCAERRANGRAATGDRNGTRRYPERVARGERCARAKLTEEDVRAIRAGGGSVAMAAQFGVSKATINQIRRGHTWRHVAAVQPARLNRKERA